MILFFFLVDKKKKKLPNLRGHLAVACIFKNVLFMYLFLAVFGLRCCARFSPVAGSRGCSLVAAQGILTAVASLVADYQL